MPDIKPLIDEKEGIFEDSQGLLIKDFANLEQAINEMILKKLEGITIRGNLSGLSEDLELLPKIQTEISKLVKGQEFNDKVTDYLKSFDKMYDLNKRLQVSVNGLQLELDEQIKPFLSQQVKIVKDNLLGGGMTEYFIKPLTKALLLNIQTWANIREVEKELSVFLESTQEKDSKLKSYVKQVSRDAIQQLDGSINQTIQKEYDLDAYMYVGVLVKDSRPQCHRWVAKQILTLEELSSEIAWMYANGKGFYRGTNKENFAIFRGGYHCLHQAIAFWN